MSQGGSHGAGDPCLSCSQIPPPGDRKQGEREFRSQGWGGQAGCYLLDRAPRPKDMVSGVTHTVSPTEY